MTEPKVIAEPRPEEIERTAELLLREQPPGWMGVDQAKRYATVIMLNDKRVERMVGAMQDQESRITALMDEVQTWLCPGCRTAFPELPGPADDPLNRYRCPHCSTNPVRLANALMLAEEKEQRAAERLNMQSQIDALHDVAHMASTRFAEIAAKETVFLSEVAEKAHWTHDPPGSWRECTRAPCNMIREALSDRTDEQDRIKTMYERATRG